MIEKRFMRMKLADIIPYDKNPRNHTTESVEDVKQSIMQCGDGEALDPIEIDENNVILCGHGRRLAMQELGIEECDVVQYIGMTEKQKKEIPNPCEQNAGALDMGYSPSDGGA